jgi:transposase
LRHKFDLIFPFLNEKQRRIILGAEAKIFGYSGISEVSRATGVSRRVISEGIKELENPESILLNRVRKKGGGRKKEIEKDSTLALDLNNLIDPVTRGDPESPLRWTSKSVRKLSKALKNKGHKICPQTVATLLRESGYSLQANRKTKEGDSHPDRDKQFEYINKNVTKFLKQKFPVISVDTKKKELVGDFKNNGKELCPKGKPEKVRVYDFKDKELGKVNPYGVFDIGKNLGWVNVGIDYDTAAFAVESIRRWWYLMGINIYPKAKKLMITADGGGSNSSRSRLWKVEMQKFSDETGLRVKICHFPPGTSKWNKIEHRLFSYISQNWRGKPLLSHEVIINLIASTTTEKGLKVDCKLDTNSYPKGRKVSDEELRKVNIRRDKFHGEWNYEINQNRIKT